MFFGLKDMSPLPHPQKCTFLRLQFVVHVFDIVGGFDIKEESVSVGRDTLCG